MSDVFISYSREDRAKAQQLAELFEQNSWSVWWDRKTAPGKRFSQVIGEELSTAKSVVVLWSQNSILSDWVKDEAQEAASRGILVPLLIEDVTIPVGFRQFQAAHLADWDGSASHPELKDVLDEISNLVSKPVIAANSSSLEAHPLHFTPRRAAITAVVGIVLLIAIVFGYKQLRENGVGAPSKDATKIVEPTPTPSPQVTPPKKVVIMDNPVLVYDRDTAASHGNNINDIAKLLLDKSVTTMDIHPVPLATDKDWDLKALVVNENPDLIIIHASCFYELTSIDDPKGTFREFLKHIGNHLPNTKLLIYSRAFQKITKADIKRYETESKLIGRVRIFPVTGGADASFRTKATRDLLMKEVEEMLRS